MIALFHEIHESLLRMQSQKQYRTLHILSGIDFCSNDYLSLSQDHNIFKKLISEKLPFGGISSRLVKGESVWVRESEDMLAERMNSQTTLLFSSGYLANIAVIQALCMKGDIIFSDQYNHASIIDGIKLSKADKIIFKHSDLEHLESLLKQNQYYQRKWIITETLFSMEATKADLKNLIFLAEKYDAYLLCDEAHATGIFGNKGRGLCDIYRSLTDRIIATIHTAGKALACQGAWVCCSNIVKNLIINSARQFICTTSISPFLAQMVSHSLVYTQDKKLHRATYIRNFAEELREFLQREYRDQFAILGSKETPFIPLVTYSNQRALDISERLKKFNIDVVAIRPPTVPDNQSRIRISLPYLSVKYHSKALMNAFKKVKKYVS